MGRFRQGTPSGFNNAPADDPDSTRDKVRLT